MVDNIFNPVEDKKGDLTDITVILDRSGSMDNVIEETIMGFNKFLREQKDLDGRANLTLVQFDDQYDVVYKNIDVKKAKELNTKTFVPRGSTSLLDAIGKTIATKKETINNAKDKPDNVVIVIITDGGENASREYEHNQVNKLINDLKKDWRFVFLGANQNAIQTGGALGINIGNSATYAGSGQSVMTAYNTISQNIGAIRSGAKMMNTAFFSSVDRSVLMDDDKNIDSVDINITNDDDTDAPKQTTTTNTNTKKAIKDN